MAAPGGSTEGSEATTFDRERPSVIVHSAFDRAAQLKYDMGTPEYLIRTPHARRQEDLERKVQTQKSSVFHTSVVGVAAPNDQGCRHRSAHRATLSTPCPLLAPRLDESSYRPPRYNQPCQPPISVA